MNGDPARSWHLRRARFRRLPALLGALALLGAGGISADAADLSYKVPPTGGMKSREVTITVNGDEARYVERFGPDGPTFGNRVATGASFDRRSITGCAAGKDGFGARRLTLTANGKTVLATQRDGHELNPPDRYSGISMLFVDDQQLAWLQKALCSSLQPDGDTPDASAWTEDGIGGASRYLVIKNNSKTKTMRVTFYSIFDCSNASIGCGDTSPMQTLAPGESRAIGTVMAENTNQPITFNYKYDVDWP